MNWKEFKEFVEKQGVKDADTIRVHASTGLDYVNAGGVNVSKGNYCWILTGTTKEATWMDTSYLPGR